jgi:predicted phosphodiesterase
MQALLYDIHGNLPALEAVLADVESTGADRFVLGGDYGAFGAWPKETIERLKELDATWIRGNVERWCAGDTSDAPDFLTGAVERCAELVGPELTLELAALPDQTVLDGVRYCHASPVSDMKGFFSEPLDDEGQLLEGVEEPRLVVGHTHLQFRRDAGGIDLVNPGSVGIPLDGDRRPGWALVRDDGEIELRRVEYDWQASADAIREVLGEAGEVPARRIEQARFDVL